MNWTVYLRDGSSADVASDEVICEGTARFVNVPQVPAERYIEVVVFAAGTRQRVEATATGLVCGTIRHTRYRSVFHSRRKETPT
jgi:hypothetical protein